MSTIRIKLKKGYTIINRSDILYIEASNKHSKIFLKNLEEIKSIHPFKFMAAQLEEPIFYRIHHSFIINCSFLKSINSRNVILQGNKEVRISRNKKKLLYENMEKHFKLLEVLV